ncbi:MAG: hypothetical protein IKI67_05650, partial [Bacteroidales bacterium]|nr:hypothetical protein [Bacteroidales bacterium]
GTGKAYLTLTLPDFKIITLDVVTINDIEAAPSTISYSDHEIDVTLINEDYDDGGIIYNSY